MWEHRHVTPGVLNRIVTLLRQALGRGEHARHYLHTVHGIGYRFDAEVRYLHEREDSNASSDETAKQNKSPGSVKPEAAVNALATSTCSQRRQRESGCFGYGPRC